MTRKRVPTDMALPDCLEHSIGLSLPGPLSERVNALVDLVDATGERTNRKELIASLILGASPNGLELAGLVRRYRMSTVREALLDPDEAGTTVMVPARKPGPRSRRKREPA